MTETDATMTKGMGSGRTRRLVKAWIVAALAMLLLVDGCASSGAIRLDSGRRPDEEVVWPGPPDPPRIRLVRSFRSTDDLGFRRSFFGRVADFVRGRDPNRVMRHPYGIAVTDEDRIYIVDSAARGLHVYDLRRSRYRFLDADGLANPVDVTVGADGLLYVSDSELGAVVVLDEGGDEVRRIDDGLLRPTGLALHPDGLLYVVDTENHEVVGFDDQGRRVSSFGGRGTEPGALNYPTLLAVGPDGNLYVSDALNFRVQVFTTAGDPVRTVGQLGDAVGEFARPKGLGVDALGRLFVVEGLYDVVNVFDPDGSLLMSFGGAGQAEGSFWLATGLTVDSRGRIFVSDSYNGRVQVFEMLDGATP